MIRAGTPDIQMTHTHDELATAQAYRAVAEFVPRIGALIDVVHRHHLISARTHFEGVLRDTSASVVCGVGFADLSGFTALTQALTPARIVELAHRIRRHRRRRGACRRRPGGEVHRRRGDVGERVARAARQGGGRSRRPPAGARGGPAGPRRSRVTARVLAINGDYFGNPVNLAARLVAAAAPGQILAARRCTTSCRTGPRSPTVR